MSREKFSKRVWQQLVQEANSPRYNDGVLRMALVTCALDPASPMTATQRQWVLEAMGQRVTPFTAEERARFKDPLLTWAKSRMPRVVEILEHQFPSEER